jgi:predicted nucleic acid-binding protein
MEDSCDSTNDIDKRPVVNVFLDSNIWIDYSWRYHISEASSRNGTCVEIIGEIDHLGENSPYMIVFSPYVIAEISHHFADWFLLKKSIANGFGYREFSKERRNHRLEESEEDIINTIINDIGTKTSVNALDIENLSKTEIEAILNLRRNNIDFYDAFHIHIALKKDCKFFVTKDGELRKRFQEILSNGSIKNDIKIISDKVFLDIVKTYIKKKGGLNI